MAVIARRSVRIKDKRTRYQRELDLLASLTAQQRAWLDDSPAYQRHLQRMAELEKSSSAAPPEWKPTRHGRVRSYGPGGCVYRNEEECCAFCGQHWDDAGLLCPCRELPVVEIHPENIYFFDTRSGRRV